IEILLFQKSKSNATQLYLRKVGLSNAGRYSCEVSADAPSFRTAMVSGDMHVVIIPKALPEVQGMKSRYKVGDVLKATCISKHSKPAANLTWAVNNQILSSDYIRQYNVMRDSKNNLETSISTVSFKVQKEHFKLNGRLKVRCMASIHNVYWRTSENSAEEERPKASVVAAQDYRLHDVYRKPNDIECNFFFIICLFSLVTTINNFTSRFLCSYNIIYFYPYLNLINFVN
ncbi:hypothetical protein AAG570_006261, partial [Ranatra chinensis]